MTTQLSSLLSCLWWLMACWLLPIVSYIEIVDGGMKGGYWVTGLLGSNSPSKVNEVSLQTRYLAGTDLWYCCWDGNISRDHQARPGDTTRYL